MRAAPDAVPGGKKDDVVGGQAGVFQGVDLSDHLFRAQVDHGDRVYNCYTMYIMKHGSLARTKMVMLRLNPEEHDRLRKDATRMYLPLSAFIRHRLFGREALKGSKRRSKGR